MKQSAQASTQNWHMSSVSQLILLHNYWLKHTMNPMRPFCASHQVSIAEHERQQSFLIQRRMGFSWSCLTRLMIQKGLWSKIFSSTRLSFMHITLFSTKYSFHRPPHGAHGCLSAVPNWNNNKNIIYFLSLFRCMCVWIKWLTKNATKRRYNFD